jgi:hypothetical protein
MICVNVMCTFRSRYRKMSYALVAEAKHAVKSIREPSVVLCPGVEAKHAVKSIREPSVVACPGVEAK